MGKFKFDVAIGNPPYQEETTEEEAVQNKQKPVKNIFQFFQEGADDVSNTTVLIYPGGRWIHQFGKGLKKFGLDQINDKHLADLYFYSDASEVFPTVQMADGISIVIKDKAKNTKGFRYHYMSKGTEKMVEVPNPGDELFLLNPIDQVVCGKIDCVVKRLPLAYLHDAILPRTLFHIESNFVEENPDKVKPCSKKTPVPDGMIRLLTNDQAGKKGRAKWFLANNDVIDSNREYIRQWQVAVSSANAGGQKRDNQMEIIDDHSAFGRSRVALKSFRTKAEAQNFFKYAKSYLIRYTFLMTDESLTSLGKRVPDIGDYTANNKFINFSQDIDAQLYKMFELSQEDIDYIEQRVKSQRHGEED